MIGIVTFHRAQNYGAVLQAYALQQTLNGLGKNNKIVDYRCKEIENRYKLFPINKSNIPKSIIKSLAAFPVRYKKYRNYNNFLKRYLYISKSYNTGDEIKKGDEFRVFITGSDQVFRVSHERFTEEYFLNFADSKQKYSYAASFGTSSVLEEYKEKVKELLSDFQKLSVREESGKKIIETLTDKKARVDLDPTLLLGKNEWENICHKVNIKSEYVLIYNVNPPINLINFAIDLAAKKNLKVIYIKDGFIHVNGNITIKRGIAPENFVSLFRNAKYVVTNSFHGTAFSLIFNKEFFVELNSPSGRNLRSEEILKELGINNREILKPHYNENDFIQINWDEANNIIEAKKSSALDYLKKV